MTLRERLQNIMKRMADGHDFQKKMLAKADDEKRDLTEQEESEFQFIDMEIQKLKEDAKRTQALLSDEDNLNQAQRTAPGVYIVPQDAPAEFRTMGEFLHSIRFNQADPRLGDLAQAEVREQSMGIGVEGGFAVPTQFLPQLRMIDPQAVVFRPRATVIPAGSPPDAAISLPTLDQTNAQNIYGGMTVDWISEGGAKPETDMKLKEVTLTPHEVAGYTVVSDKLLRNWGAAEATISNMLRLCVAGAEDTAFLSGTGVGRPLGVINSPAVINVARTTANQIAFADAYGMLARAKFGGSLVWIGSQTILPQLISMVDAGTNSVWLPGGTSGAANAPPGTLFGIPLIFNERSPALGSTGDLMLCDLSYYLIKDGSGPFVAASPHVYFTSNKTVIKIFWNVDGQPWLGAPLPLEGSTANTVSPFVVLN